MTVSTKLIDYKDVDGTIFEGVVYIPEIAKNSKVPAVLVFPAFRGITEFEKDKGHQLAELGYFAFVADVYGKGVRPTERADAFATMGPLVSNRFDKLKPRLFAAIDSLKTFSEVDQSKVAAIGYCFGGLCVLDLARYNSGIKAVVSFHGTLKPIPDLSLDKITETTVLVHHGDADFHIGKDQIDGFHEEMRTREADFVFVSHAKAVHAFTEPDADSFNAPGIGYNEKAAKRSWRSCLNLLTEVFI
uniref:DLH domain-containing protein n=1 Tax=Caenorhabditis tropicalis TaxID=1561998 RepID=A0A1I7T030_9PELO